MSESTEFSIEDLITVTSPKADDEMREPTVEQLMGKLRKLQQGKVILEEELKQYKSASESLEKEQETLRTKAYELERIHKEKEDICRKLQLQCEESEQESARHLNLNKKCKELLEQYTCEIQEFKLKHRKQRMKFENQLNQLIELHKNLHAVFALERLPDEIKIAENAKSQLLLAEQLKLDQLHCLDVELTKQNEIGTAVAEEE